MAGAAIENIAPSRMIAANTGRGLKDCIASL